MPAVGAVLIAARLRHVRITRCKADGLALRMAVARRFSPTSATCQAPTSAARSSQARGCTSAT